MSSFRCFGILCWAFFSPLAWAQSSGKSLYLLTYFAPESCATQTAFQQRLVHHASEWESTSSQGVTPGVNVSVRIDPQAGDFVAAVELLNREGQISKRELRSAKCTELVEGAALIASVFLAGLPEVRKPVVAPAELPKEPTSKPPLQWRTRAHAQVGLRTGLAPALANVVSVGAEVFPLTTHWLAWRVRVLGSFAWSDASADVNPLQYSAWLGRLEVCPLQLTWSVKAPLAVQGCLLAEGGSMLAAWSNSPSSLRSGPWVAPGASGRFSWSLWRGLSLETELFAVRPLVLNRFTLEDSTLFSVPSISVGGAAGLGWRF